MNKLQQLARGNMKHNSEKVIVTGVEFIKITSLTNDLSDLDEVENFWLQNITIKTAKMLARHFKAYNPSRVIVEACSEDVCAMLFTVDNCAETETLDLVSLGPEAAHRTVAILPFSRVGGLVLENLDSEAIDRVCSMLPISHVIEIWLDRLTPENTLKVINYLPKTKIVEAHYDNHREVAAARLPQEKPNNELAEQTTFLQSLVDRQLSLLTAQQQFMRTHIPAAAQLPFFQQPDSGSKKRRVEDGDSVSKTNHP
jgi:hypothetical protein